MIARGARRDRCAGRLGARLLVLASAAGALTGCSVPLKEVPEELTNQCGTDTECGSAGVCRDGICVSTSASLTGLLLQVDLPTTAPFGAGSSTLLDPASAGVSFEGQDPSGFWLVRDLVVPPLVSITDVRLQVSPAPDGCVPAPDGSMPISVQLQPAELPVGLPLPVYSAESVLVDGGTRYACPLAVPAGSYDIFMQVRTGSSDDDPNARCPLPPVLLTGHDLAGSELAVNVSVGAPTLLTGAVTGLSTNVHLAGWTIELVENGDGRPISTSQTFGRHALGSSADQAAALPGSSAQPETRDGGSAPAPAVPFEVAFWPELVSDALIRLTPPADRTAMPTLLWRLDAVDLDGDHHVGLDLSALSAAAALLIEGTVLDETGGTGVGATITIQSEQLLGGQFGANAAYRTTADAGANGKFSTYLLPGDYKVVAVPGADPSRAITSTTWKINPNDLGGGRTIVLNPRASLAGSVQTAAGNPAYDVSCYVQPSTSPALPYLEKLLTTYDVLPSTATALTDPAGGFLIPVDPGTFDFSIRPGEQSGFPWLVSGNVVIQPSGEATVAQLGSLALSNPVVLSGFVRTPSGTGLAGAIVRAWLPVFAEEGGESDRPTVLQLGRAVSGPDGSYGLLLPASVAQ